MVECVSFEHFPHNFMHFQRCAGRTSYFCGSTRLPGNQNSLATKSIVQCRVKRPTAQLSLNTVFVWTRREHLRGFKITIGIIAANERHVVHLFFIEIILTHPHDLGVNLTDDLKRGEFIVTTKLLCFQFLMNGKGTAGYWSRRGVAVSVAWLLIEFLKLRWC